ncbi:MAG: FAD-dependent oxidoreductase [Clostridia bacterium]|nr:FAD-dependent oxidoreductase [Clostridia bacterium]
MSETIFEPGRELPVSSECDVLVCGGGVAGIAAALSAARNGARVTLLEREFMLGGLGTLGLVTIYLPLCDGKGHQVSFGIAEELFRLSIERGVVEGRYPKAWLESGTLEEKIANRFQVQYNPHIFAVDAERVLLAEGVHILYGTIAAQTVVEDGKITAVIVENKSGRSAIRVKSVVDATGDADVCALSGADCAVHGLGNVLAAWYYRYTKEKGVQLKMLGCSDIPEEYHTGKEQYLTDRRFGGIDAQEISEMVQQAHQISLADAMKLRETDPTAVPVIYPTIPQLRMTRRIAGIATPDDKPTHVYVPDSIGMIGDWRKRGPVYELPFACLYGGKVKNLITAGRCISVTDSMWDITRVIPVCAVTGEAAGAAAAMSDDFASLNVASLQERLVRGGVKLHCADVGL